MSEPTDLKSWIGRETGPYTEEAPAERLRAFQAAVGTDTRSDVAPPTFLTLFRQGEFDLFKKMGIELSQVLHGEQEYVYGEPIRAGDRIRFKTSLSKAFEKKGSTGLIRFMVLETPIEILRGDQVLSAGTSRTTVLVR